MGFRFRKSKNIGPFRINLSKTGVGWSVGTKGARFTKRADGKKQTTFSVSGTGISYVNVEESNNKKDSSNNSCNETDPTYTADTQMINQPPNNNKPNKPLYKKPWFIILAILFALLVLGNITSTPVTNTQVTTNTQKTEQEQEAKKADEKRIADEQAAKKAEEDRIANEQAAKKAEEKRIAAEQAAKKAEEKRIAAEQASQKAAIVTPAVTVNTEPSKAASSQNKEQTVYVTATGHKYHRIPKCGNTKSSRPVTLQEAEDMGLSPCKKCF